MREINVKEKMPFVSSDDAKLSQTKLNASNSFYEIPHMKTCTQVLGDDSDKFSPNNL